jgi:hypothetical protein
VLLRRYDIEAVGQRALRRGELTRLVDEATGPFFARFALSRERVRTTIEALLGFLRLCEPHATANERLRVASRQSFPDALWLFELLAEATGEGLEELAQWQAAARRRPVLAGGVEVTRPQRAADGAAGRGKPRSRRRRRRPTNP